MDERFRKIDASCVVRPADLNNHQVPCLHLQGISPRFVCQSSVHLTLGSTQLNVHRFTPSTSSGSLKDGVAKREMWASACYCEHSCSLLIARTRDSSASLCMYQNSATFVVWGNGRVRDVKQCHPFCSTQAPEYSSVVV